MGYWDDFNVVRPGTPGGEQRIAEAQRPADFPVAPPEPKIADLPGLPPPVKQRPPKVKRSLTKLDFLIFVIVFFVAWIMLAASAMDAGNAAVFAVFAGAIASMWWRSLIVIAIIGVILAIAFMQ
jgi:hypothetical protein